MKIYDLTVDKGKEIKQAVRDFVITKGWSNVLILGAVGSVINLKFNVPANESLPVTTLTSECLQAAEILSFTGEVMSFSRVDPQIAALYAEDDSSLFVHIHASCASRNGVMGGGLIYGQAFRSLRIFLIPMDE